MSNPDDEIKILQCMIDNNVNCLMSLVITTVIFCKLSKDRESALHIIENPERYRLLKIMAKRDLDGALFRFPFTDDVVDDKCNIELINQALHRQGVHAVFDFADRMITLEYYPCE